MIEKLRILKDIIELTDHKIGLNLVSELIEECEAEHPEEVIGYVLVTYINDEPNPLYYCGYVADNVPMTSTISQEAAVYIDEQAGKKALEFISNYKFTIEEHVWS